MANLQQRVASPISSARPFSSRGLSALQAAASHSPTPSSLGRSHPRATSLDAHLTPATSRRESAQVSFSEWSYFGFGAVLSGLAELRRTVEEPSPLHGGAASATASATEPATSQLLSCRFGGNRWKLEILRRLDAEDGSGFSLYLACGLDDYYTEDIVIPTSMMVSVKEPGCNRSIIWQTWGEHHFSHDQEFWECHTFPSLADLLSNPKVAGSDKCYLSVQLQSPLAGPLPEVQDARHVPSNLLAGLSSLPDDKRTGDVQFVVYERKTENEQCPSGSQPASITSHPMYRKRTIYAHSALLRARSSYFYDMFGNEWLENKGSVNVVRIVDCDYVSLYWLLSWLYTDSIAFTDAEDNTDLCDDFAGGVLLSRVGPGYEWQRLHCPSEGESTGTKSPEPRIPLRSATSLGHATDRPAQKKVDHVSAANPSSASSSTRKNIGVKKRAATQEPLGKLSPVQTFTAMNGVSSPPPQLSRNRDSNLHPAQLDTLPSALRIYKIANRYILPDLADSALHHIISSLTPSSAFPLLLATNLYPELYTSIKAYCLCNYKDVSTCPVFKTSLQDISIGVWGEAGGEVLFDLMTSLSPS